MAIAFGIPDNESRGLTASEFTKVLSKALKRIEYLETVLDTEKVAYTKTDW